MSSLLFQWDDKGELLVEDGSLEDNVESFFSPDETDPRDAIGRCMDISKGLTCFVNLLNTLFLMFVNVV